MHQRYVITYDISNNKERRLVSKVLEGYGFRVQKSVFECLLNKRLLRELKAGMEKLEVCDGYVLFYRLSSRVPPSVIGSNIPANPDAGFSFVV
jgi:CRISPR-associated protein Cas2